MKFWDQDFRKWGVHQNEKESRFERTILILLLYAVLFSLVLGIITGTLFLIIEAVLMFIIYLSPRLSRFGNRYLKHMETNFFAEVRSDRIPEFSLVSDNYSCYRSYYNCEYYPTYDGCPYGDEAGACEE